MPNSTAKVEEIVAREMAKVKAVADTVKPKVEGKLAMMFVGGSRAIIIRSYLPNLGYVLFRPVMSSLTATTTKAVR
jgi:nitrogenase molybdenum-iron protein alpha/beta subunit